MLAFLVDLLIEKHYLMLDSPLLTDQVILLIEFLHERERADMPLVAELRLEIPHEF